MARLYLKNKTIHENVETILFDKDGTLIDIHHYWGAMIKKRAEVICKKFFEKSFQKESIYVELVEAMGIDLKTGRMKRNGPVGIKPRTFIAEVVKDIVIKNDIKIENEDIEEIFNFIDTTTAQNLLPYLKILPGVECFLKSCQEKGLLLAVISTDITKRVEVTMKALKLESYFKFLLGGDLVPNSKPAPDLVHHLGKRANLALENTACIGDHPVDIQMGHSSGVSCNIGVLTGLASFSDFQALPCYVAKSFEEIHF